MKKLLVILSTFAVLVMAVCFVACGGKGGGESPKVGGTPVSGAVTVKDSAGSTLYTLQEGKEAPTLAWNIAGSGNVYSWYALADGAQITVIDDERFVKNDSGEYLLRTLGVTEVTVYPKEFYTLLTVDGTEIKSKAINGTIPVMLNPLSRDYSTFDYFYIKNAQNEEIPITDSFGYFTDVWSRTDSLVTVYARFTSQEFPLVTDFCGEVSSKGNIAAVPAALAYGESFDFSLPVPEKPGYDFDGWYTAAAGGTRITDGTGAYSGNADKLIGSVYDLTSGEVKIYAHWKPRTYRVYFYDGDLLLNSTGMGVEFGGKITPLTHEKNLLEFAFWHRQNEDTPFDFVNTTMSFADLNLYGEWRNHVLAEGDYPCVSGYCITPGCGEYVAATAEHVFGLAQTIEPTCTDAGYSAHSCTVCKTTETIATLAPALGHDFVVENYTDKTECCQRCSVEAERTLLAVPSGTTAIAAKQFEGCTSLVSVILPKSLRAVDVDAFKGCTALKTVYFEGGAAADWQVSVVAGQAEFSEAASASKRYYLVQDAASVPSGGGNYWYYENQLPVFAHSHNYSLVTVPSTCTETGYTYNLCTVCGDTQVQTYIPAAHTPSVSTAKCLDVKCTVCSEVLEKATEAHKFGELTSVRDATCVAVGSAKQTCEKCNYDKITDTPVIDHIFDKASSVEASCVSAGYDIYACRMCSVSEKRFADGEDETSYAGHNYNRSTVVATSTRLGYYTYICSVCLDSAVTYFDFDGNQYVSIGNTQELIAARSNNTLNYLLTADIDLAGTQWTPWGINGSEQKPYSGVFNGNGHKISGYTVTTASVGALAAENGSTELSVGFFGAVTGKVLNLSLYGDLDLTDAHSTIINIGGIAGKVNGQMEAVAAFGKVLLTSADAGVNAGGLVGSLNGKLVESVYRCAVTDSYSINVFGRSYTYVGGLCGITENGSLVSNCLSDCTLSANSAAADCNSGGAVGVNNGKLFRTVTAGTVASTGALKGAAGGLTGINNGSVGYCLATCAVGAEGYDLNQTFSGAVTGFGAGILNNAFARDGVGVTAKGTTVGTKAPGEVTIASTDVYSVQWQKNNIFKGEAVLWAFTDGVLPSLKSGEQLITAANTVYEISSKDELLALDGGILHYELKSNLKLGNAKLLSMDSFYGTLNGNGYSIKGFCFSKNSPYEALFAENYGTIDNIILTDYYAEGKSYTQASVNGIAGVNHGTIGEAVTAVKSRVNLPVVWQYVLGIGIALLVGLFLVLSTAKSEGGKAVLWALVLLAGLVANGVCGFVLSAKLITVCVAATSVVAAGFLAYASFSFYDRDTCATPGGIIACVDGVLAVGYVIAALLLL